VHEHLWLGVDGRIREAERSYREMGTSISRPDHTWENAALVAAGVDVNRPWQDTFYPNVSTFLAKVRSVPSIIEACFGKDSGIRRIPPMKDWWDSLTLDEQQRREEFSDQFRADNKLFRDHYLTNERDVSEHRLGFPNVEARVVGPFGKEHIARPDRRIPSAEPRPLEPNINNDPALMWAATLPPRPIDPPRWDQWTICGKPLFDECRAYLQLASDIRGRAQVICDAVHGAQHVSAPPT
jgi:hypothetical protein